MKILSIQVGLPKTVTFRGKAISTSIFKSAVSGPVLMRSSNLDGDGQSDLSVHGGIDKAVYGYSVDTYPWWQTQRPMDIIEFGSFGENLSIDTLPEDQVFIGDTFEVGDAIIQVSQPRFPCYKLGVKFNDPSILKEFMTYGRPGVYFRVLKEGIIESGQLLKRVNRESVLLSVYELFRMSKSGVEVAEARKYLKIASLPKSYLDVFKNIVDSG
jgi:MOSC domain-containing protein YiiM